MRSLIITLYILSCAIGVGGANLTVGEKTYFDYKITGGTSIGIQIIHEFGVAAIPVEAWPDVHAHEIEAFLPQYEIKKAQAEFRIIQKSQIKAELTDIISDTKQIMGFSSAIVDMIVDKSSIVAASTPINVYKGSAVVPIIPNNAVIPKDTTGNSNCCKSDRPIYGRNENTSGFYVFLRSGNRWTQRPSLQSRPEPECPGWGEGYRPNRPLLVNHKSNRSIVFSPRNQQVSGRFFDIYDIE